MQVNPKAAESLADPEEYPNLFEDWQVALAVESKAIETRLVWKMLIFLHLYYCFDGLVFSVHMSKKYLLTIRSFFRNVYPPAEQYISHADKSHVTLVEAFRNMQIEEEEPLENGDSNYEV